MEVMGEDLVESEVNVDVPLRNTNNDGVKLNLGNYKQMQHKRLRGQSYSEQLFDYR